MKNVRRSFWLVSLALILFPCVEGRAADVFLETTRSEFQKIPVRIVGFGDEAVQQCNPATVDDAPADILKADLQRTQLFEVIGQPTASPDLSQDSCLGTNSLAEAGTGDALVITWGRFSQQNGKLILEACAHDEGGKTVAKYRGSPPSRELQRRMVHRWADKLVKYYTGESGVAQTEIVYVVGGKTGGRALYVMDYDGSGPRPVTETNNLALMPTWLPDRRSLVYTIYRQYDQEIVQLDLDSGATPHTVVPRESLNITPAFSPDGQLIAYASATQGNSNIFIVNVQTKEKTQMTFHHGADLSPTWSPDGRTLAFMSDRGGEPQIYTMPVDGSRVRRLTFDGSYNAAPAWSPRGDWVAYVCRVPTAGFRLCRITPDGQQREQITNGSRWAMEDSPSWAPDGRHLVFSSMQDGQSHLYTIHVDGTGLEPLTRGDQHHSSPAWSPFYDRVVPCRRETVTSSAG